MSNKYGTASTVFMFLLMCHLASGQQLRDAFRRVKSAVVVVHCRDSEGSNSPAGGATDEEGVGSGVLISQDGKVLTAAHVVEKENGVEFANGERMIARVVASSASADL